jgi:hypothetical protein
MLFTCIYSKLKENFTTEDTRSNVKSVSHEFPDSSDPCNPDGTDSPDGTDEYQDPDQDRDQYL